MGRAGPQPFNLVLWSCLPGQRGACFEFLHRTLLCGGDTEDFPEFPCPPPKWPRQLAPSPSSSLRAWPLLYS